MTPEEITLIQQSFQKVIPIQGTAGRLFYERLFEIAPEVKPLFSNTDMAAQGATLMKTLGAIVAGLSNLDKLVPVAAGLAKRHVDYGVEADHYPKVGAALIDTLKAGLGDAFTPETEAAWAKAYGILSQAMIGAAYGEKAAA